LASNLKASCSTPYRSAYHPWISPGEPPLQQLKPLAWPPWNRPGLISTEAISQGSQPVLGRDLCLCQLSRVSTPFANLVQPCQRGSLCGQAPEGHASVPSRGYPLSGGCSSCRRCRFPGLSHSSTLPWDQIYFPKSSMSAMISPVLLLSVPVCSSPLHLSLKFSQDQKLILSAPTWIYAAVPLHWTAPTTCNHSVPNVFAQLGTKGTGMRPAASKTPSMVAARAERCKQLY